MRITLLFSLLASFVSSLTLAEGSKNLTPQSSGTSSGSNLFIGWLQHDDATRSDDFLKPGAPADQRLYIYIKSGETVYYGLRRVLTNDQSLRHEDLVLNLRDNSGVLVNTSTLFADITSTDSATFLPGTGVIETRDAVNAGPSAIVGASGYNAISYTNNTGVDQDFYIEFDQQGLGDGKKSWYDLWDFSVFNGTEEQTGRVHAQTWSFTAGSGSGRFSTDFELFAAVPTVIGGVSGGYFIKAIDLGGIQPFGLLIYANSTGSDISGVSDLNGDGVIDFLDARRTQDDDANVTSEYDIFINNPDLTLYPTSELPTVEITNAVFFCAANGNGNAVIGFNTNQIGEVAVIVDLNGSSGYQVGTTDVIIEEQISTTGSHEIYWDGLDGLGNPVPSGTTITISGRFTSGPTHFPLFDIEDNNFSSADNPAGISVRDVRPTTSFDLIYWDDRSVNILSDPEVELNGTNEADHFWDDGDNELVNTWSYGYYQINSQTINFDYICDGDGDSINNNTDDDSDNDGISDEEEGNFKNDADGDGVPDYVDPDLPGFVDENNDGINDNFDIDQDGIPNALDKDSDNDGIPDVIEAGYTDADNDGEIDCPAGTASAFNVSLTVTDNGGNQAIDNGLVFVSTTSSAVDVAGSTLGSFIGTDFYMEAECATIGSNWTTVVDATASNGNHVVYTGTGSNDNPPVDIADNYVRFTFDVTTSGVYEVYARVDTDNDGGNDSFWVRVDGGSFVQFNTINGADGFLWEQVFDSQNGNALQSYDLDIGTHTVDFAYRENGTKLDQVLISLSTSVNDADPAGTAFNCNAFPTSDIQVTSTSGTSPFTVNFDGTGSSDTDGTITAYNWDFGDGNSSMSSTPQNIFSINGSVSDNDNNGQCDIAQDPNYIIPNKDGDGLADYLDLDSDNDGIVDVIEAGGEADPATGQIASFVDTDNDGLNDILEIDPLDRGDFDSDGLPNYLDIDSDNDGIRDYIEAQASDAFIEIAVADANGNGIYDIYDPTNGGTFLDPVNTDNSPEEDYIDVDSDEDGVEDVIEGHDTNFDGIGDWDVVGSDNDITNEPAYLLDDDNDGLLNIFDTDNGGTTAPIQNTDGADKRDWQDSDDDNDGQPTLGEDTNGNANWADDYTQGQGASPTIPDYLFRGDYDGDAIPDRLDADSDNDGILDSDEDNGEILDPGSDDDNDGIPNYRDADEGPSLSSSADINGDGVFDVYDTDLDGTPDFLDLDSDNDGILDGIEANDGVVPFGFNEATGQFNLQDPDNDGLMNYIDADDVTRNTKANAVSDLNNPDGDNDGIRDYLDIDSDNDGITDNVEAQTSAAYIAVVALDANGNGVYDVYDPDNGGTLIVPVNTDSQDLQDYRDTDSDNDGFLDIVEGDDANNDGRGEWDLNTDGNIDTNEELLIDTNNNGIQDAADAALQVCTDANMDGICDSAQNDVDTDGDFLEDAVDPDDDNDGLQDAFDTVNLITTGIGNSTGSNADLQNTDGTDQPDWRDTDDDNDGLISSTENGPDGMVPIPDYLTLSDFDGDGVDDIVDEDSDNDGVPDSQEAGTTGVDPSGDDDADGIFNFRDSDIAGFVDTNNDGVDDRGDKDLDGIPDFHDLDSDNDGIPDALEANKGVLPPNMNDNGQYPNAYMVANDLDGDGLANDVDIDFATGSPLPTLDTDGDGLLDFLDLDADDDGLPDISEVGGTDIDGDGKVDDLTDSDSDGLPDVVDSDNGGTAFTIPDSDGDLVPDFADVDSDNDGVTDPIENGQPDTDGNGKIDQFSNDADNDGLADRVDPDSGGIPITKLDGDGDTIPNYQDLDSDNDALSDIFEAGGTDTDNDGQSDDLLDTDNDGVPDSADNSQTAVGDTDGDQIDNNADADIDGDAIPNNYDQDIVASGDVDGDNIIDAGDVDIDGDGINNRFDVNQTAGTDGNANGIDDAFDVLITGGTDANGDGIDDALYVEDDVNRDGIDDNGFIDIDIDNDGIRDSRDPDANGNGLDDDFEAEPLPVLDTDQDGFENYRDLDADNDGIVDVTEIGLTPESGTGRISGFAANDANGTGWHDTYEGLGNAVTPGNSDVEVGDTYVNPVDYLDIDADNDGIPDNIESQTRATYIAPAAGDTDGDGLLDVYDPDNGGNLISPVNTDGDVGPTPDYLDDDSDDDNVPDDIEGDNADKSQYADWDTGLNNSASDETGYKVDVDADGLWDLFDEYPGTGISNVIGTLSAIQDSDRDGTWDFQDIDDDNDGLNTSSQGGGNEDSNSDADPTNDFDDDVNNIIPNYLFGVADRDGDGVDDIDDLDSDNDGLRDTDESGGSGIDPSGDIDNDGLFNYEDPDMDGDGTINRLDSDVDDPANSTPDGLNVDDEDGDGVFDIFDKDRDGIPDYLDIDADNDGIADIIENGLTDANGDGTVNEGSGIIDVNSNGLDDTYDPTCDGVSTQNYFIETASVTLGSVTNVTNVQGATDGLSATLVGDNSSNTIRLDFGFTISSGETIFLNWAEANGNPSINISISTDGTNFSPGGSQSPSSTTVIAEDSYVLGGDARYIELNNTTNQDVLVDAVRYNGVVCSGNVGTALSAIDTDVDGIDNYLDLDSDNDGIADIVEGQSTAGYIAPVLADTDLNGRMDVFDASPIDPVNTDSPSDALPDYLDTDSDEDGVPDNIEGFDINSDGLADWDTDNDNDVSDEAGFNNDVDNDGILFVYDSNNGIGSLANINDGTNAALQDTDAALDANSPDWRDSDDDGDMIDTDTEDVANGANLPADFTQGGITIPDYLFNPDKDGDGVLDEVDQDSDNDGIPNIVEYHSTVYSGSNGPFGDDDADGLYNYLDADATGFVDDNGDNIDDRVDQDKDGIPNFFDLDSDNDGIADMIEVNLTDTNSDGTVDEGTFTDTNANGLEDTHDFQCGTTGGAVAILRQTSVNDPYNSLGTVDGGRARLNDLADELVLDLGEQVLSGTTITVDARDGNDTNPNTNQLTVEQSLDGATFTNLQNYTFVVPDVDTDLSYVLSADTRYLRFTMTVDDGNNVQLDRVFYTRTNPCAGTGALVAIDDTDSDDVLPNYLDLDSDNDGITDHVEGQTTPGYTAPSGDDTDGDGLDDAFDGNNGGAVVIPTNTDGTDEPDYLDTDSDNDIDDTVLPSGALGIGDIIEGFDANRNGFSELDTDLDGALSDETGYNIDSDNDGLWDIFDSFSGFGITNILGSNADLQDTDSDGIRDWRDVEDDNDLKVSNAEDVDGDGIWTNDKEQAGGATPDYLFFNDTDQDGIPDGTDADADNDGIPDKDEQLDSGLPLPLGNADGDSFFNYIDPDLPGFVDSNGDGINDVYDFDLDGVPNALDLDSDNDGIPDAVEANAGTLPTGADANGQFPESATDVDNDGLAGDADSDDNNVAVFDTTLPLTDTDGDGNPDFLDIDADNDGIVDLVEGGGSDFNGDGQIDAFGDTDGDGLANDVDSDNSGTPLTLPNTDGLGGPNYIDRNSDEDSSPDFDEGFDDDEDGNATGAGEDYEARATAYGDAGKYDPADLSWVNNFLNFGSTNYYDTDGDGLVDLFDPDNGGNWYGNVLGIPDNDTNGIPNVLDDDGLEPLPLTWLSFEGWFENYQVDLEWKTTDEDNVSHFDIEWSVDGVQFSVIDQKAAANTLETINTYRLTDRRFAEGFNYYRLNQVDFDGASEYSETILVLASESPFSLTIYPNPAVDFVRVEGSVPLPLGEYTMYDLSGRIVMNGNTLSVNRLNLDIRHLTKGIYHLIVQTPAGVYRSKLIKGQ